MNQRLEQEQLRLYLLGKLSEAERLEFEERLFADDDLEERLQEAEYDLLDDYARGSLPAGEHEAVQRRYPQQRLRVATTLSAVARSPRVRSRKAWPLVAAAAVFLCALPAVHFYREASQLREELRAVAAVPPQPQAPIATLALRTQTTRGSAPPLFTIPRGTSLIRIELNAEPGFEFYTLRIESAERGLVATQGVPASAGVVRGYVSSDLLTPGDYDVVLSGTRAGQSELIATYPCRLQFR
jgi:hypothetical protein